MKRVWKRCRWAAPVAALAAGCTAVEDGHVRFPDPGPPAIARCSAEPLPAPAARVVPVSLDAVLRLAEGQNAQLAVARERVNQAFAEQDLAAAKALPDVSTGVGYYRHEGGIQDQDGTLVRSSTGAVLAGLDVAARLDLRAAAFAQLDAARKALQQQGELSRLTRETLLDAATTYVDLLAAQSAVAVTKQLETDLRALLERARKLAEVERGARVEVVRIEAELSGQELTTRKLESQAKAAAAKLAYLLGLDPACTEPEPVDGQLVAFRLTDATRPVCDLVSEALANGPGVKELEGILSLIQEGMAKAEGPSRFLPVLQAQMLEGGFGAGPNGSLTFTNRFDVAVQARWNVSDLFSANAQRRVGNSLLAQTQLTYTDLRGKLALGVQETREAILSGEEQLRFAADAIRQAKSAADLSDTRQREGIQGSSFSEVLLAKRTVAVAQLGHVGALRDYDKAQLRLFVLLSLGHAPCASHPPTAVRHPPAASPPPAAPLPPPFNANTYP